MELRVRPKGCLARGLQPGEGRVHGNRLILGKERLLGGMEFPRWAECLQTSAAVCACYLKL